VGLIWGGVTRSEKGVRVGPGGQQGADTVEAVAGQAPAAQRRGAERGRGGPGMWAQSAIVGRPREKGDGPGPNGIVRFLN
jgi:hypothetical protein